MALQAELQELIALALGVCDGEIGFGLSVGGADDVCGLVHTALKLAYFVLATRSVCLVELYVTFVATGLRVGIDCVDIGVVARFTEGTVCAVRLELLAKYI